MSLLERTTPDVILTIFLCISLLAIKDVLPEVLTHLGPKQLGALRELTKGRKPEEIKEAVGEEDEDVPSLVNQNFEKAAEK